MGEKTIKIIKARQHNLIFKEGKVIPLEGAGELEGEVQVVVDRLVFRPEEGKRCIDSLEQALQFGQGNVVVHVLKGKTMSTI